MKFNLDGLTVYFPYSRIYLEQYQYMSALKRTLDAAAEDAIGVSVGAAAGGGMAGGGRAAASGGGAGGRGKHALLEMPTGTGKTVCLLSLITSYQYAHPKSAGKLVYCTRTVPEMNAVMEELGVVLRYREKCILEDERAQAAMALDAEEEEDEGMKTAPALEPTNDSNNDDDVTMNEGNIDDTTTSPPPAQRHPQQKRRKIYHGGKRTASSGSKFNDDEDEDKSTPTLGPSTAPNGAGMNGTLAICLSSRRNMCINEQVLQMSDREGVDAACRALTAPWARERAEKARNRRVSSRMRQQHHEEDQSSMLEDEEAMDDEVEVGGDGNGGSIDLCQYYENFAEAGESTSMPSGIYDLNSLKLWAKSRQWCPYYLTRRAINHASILVFNYQYMLDPKVAKMVSSELESSSIIVFDEAHNIDSVCIEAFSVTVDSRRLELATRSLGRLSSEISKVKATDGARLQAEYQNLVNGLIDQGLLVEGTTVGGAGGGGAAGGNNTNNVAAIIQPGITSGLASNVLSEDVINECVPGNIRRAEHFIAFMKKIVEYMKSRLRNLSGPDGGGGGGGVTSETPLAFLHRMVSTTSLEVKALKFAYSRLSSLLNTLRVTNLDDYGALSDVADFACLVSTYSEGPPRFAIISEPNVGSSASSNYSGPNNPGIQLACLDSSLAITPVFKRFGSVIITSGTLSPMNLYPKLLQFEPAVMESFNMSTFRPCIHPLVISRGSDQLPVSTRFQDRGDLGVVRNYGTMMVELCSAIPDGVVAFFTSYSYMESIISEWDGMGIMRQLAKSKLVFIETKDVVETTMALDNFRRACDSGRGAVFLSVARGKVSEGINFDRHYGRAVIMFGVPFQYTLSHILRARLEYLQTQHQIREQDFLNFDALRQTSQCVGRVIRSKIDYGLMIFADARYNRHDKRSKLPKWILQFLGDGQLNLSTDSAIGQVKHFLRVMAQPVDQTSLKEVLLTVEEVKALVR